jgi:hypothetical protein
MGISIERKTRGYDQSRMPSRWHSIAVDKLVASLACIEEAALLMEMDYLGAALTFIRHILASQFESFGFIGAATTSSTTD